MKYIISDTSKFEQINLEENKQLNFCFKKWKKSCWFDETCGSPKVHESVVDNCPKFCPILSVTWTPTFKLVKFLVFILSPLTVTGFSVHESFSFEDKGSGFYPDHFMASLDVERFFTNIPVNEVIDICIDDLFCDNNTIHNLNPNDIKELLTLVAHESFFIFDQVIFRQTDGVATSCPLCQILANAFLCHFEKQ